ERLEATPRLFDGAGIDEERARAQRREILQRWADCTVAGNLVVGRDRGLGIGLGKLGRFAHAREMTITGRPVDGDLAERRLGLAAFAGFGERAGSLESGAALGGLLALPPHIAAPSRNRREQQNGCRDGIIAVAVPQLLELFSTDFLVDFLKAVGHERPRQPRART